MHYTRRNILRGMTLGSGSLVLSPIAQALSADAAGVDKIPKRFVFIVKSSGIDKQNLVPAGLPAYEENSGQNGKRLLRRSRSSRNLSPSRGNER